MTSPILAGLGLVSTLFAFVFLLRRWRLLPEAEGATLGTFGLIVLANFLLLLCYHWGQLEDFVAARLALPLLLLFALASAFVMGRWIRTSRAWVVLLALPLTWTVLVALPVTARADSTGMFLPFREARWQLDFVRAHREKRAFFVMHSPHPAILLREPSTSIVGFAERPEQVDFHLREGTYNEIYVFQRLAFNPTKGTWAPAEDNELGPEFILETLEERRFQPFFRTRLSRLQAIDLSRKLPRPEGWKPAFPVLNLELDQKDTDPANQYVRKYLSQLP